MRRLAGSLISGSLLAALIASAAFAAPTPPTPATPPPQIQTHTVAARAHLIFRSDGPDAALEGRVTVVEHPTGTMVVEQIAPACESDCARRRLALMADDSMARE